MGLVVPIWIWLPVMLWVLWRYERGKRQRLEMRIVGWQEAGVEKRIAGEAWKQIEEKRDEIRAGRVVGRARELGEMRNIVIVAVVGILSAFLWARSSVPTETLAESASPGATGLPGGGVLVAPHREGRQVMEPWEPRAMPSSSSGAAAGPSPIVIRPGAAFPAPAVLNPPAAPPEVSRAPNLQFGSAPTANPTLAPGAPAPGVISLQPH